MVCKGEGGAGNYASGVKRYIEHTLVYTTQRFIQDFSLGGGGGGGGILSSFCQVTKNSLSI